MNNLNSFLVFSILNSHKWFTTQIIPIMSFIHLLYRFKSFLNGLVVRRAQTDAILEEYYKKNMN
jgi:hypothetical protein